MSKVGRSDAPPPRVEPVASPEPLPVRTAAPGGAAVPSPNRRTRQLVEHSAPGASGALGPGATVRNATLRAWGKEPKEVIDTAVVDACPGLDRTVVSELTARGMFGPLARTLEARNPLMWALDGVPVIVPWLRAFETAQRVMHDHPAQRAVDLETWGARFHAARAEGDALQATLRATHIDREPDSTSDRAAFNAGMERLRAVWDAEFEAKQQLAQHPIQHAVMQLVHAVECAVPALKGTIAHTPPFCLDAKAYQAFVVSLRGKVEAAQGARFAPYFDMLARLASTAPREARSYERMVADGRALLPKHMCDDIDALGAFGLATDDERRALLLESIALEPDIGKQVAGVLALLEAGDNPRPVATEEIIAAIDNDEQIAAMRAGTSKELARAKARNAVGNRVIAHMTAIRAALVESSDLSHEAARVIAESVRLMPEAVASLGEQLADVVRIANGQGFATLKLIGSTDGRARYDHIGLVDVGDLGVRGVLHEACGHGAEAEDPALFAESMSFVRARSHGDELVKLNTLPESIAASDPETGYGDHELALEGRVLVPYILKVYRSADGKGEYRDRATEVCAVGRDFLTDVQGMTFLAYDPEYFYFILAGLRPNADKPLPLV